MNFTPALIALYLLTTSVCKVSSKINIEINANSQTKPLKHFWKSTGLCPPKPQTREAIYNFFQRQDQKINLALIGSLPFDGIKQVRIHWLLNLIGYGENGHNFIYLDKVIDFLQKYRLRPRFELMGYPEGSNRNQEIDSYHWYNLTKSIASHYIEKYGILEVSKWRFESWNEPDLKTYNTLNFTLQGYLAYLENCSKGLTDAFAASQPNLYPNLGGPAGLFKNITHHPLCWGTLQNCHKQPNSCPLKFISFHRKGQGHSSQVTNETLSLLDQIQTNFPNLKHIPISNDEADMVKTWSKSYEFRADVNYAAMAAEVIIDFFKIIHLKLNWTLETISNDNAFLNYHPYYFTQRTLFARFQINNTSPPHAQFIKKPIYCLMGLLSLLDKSFIPDLTSDRSVRVLATKSNTSLAVLITKSSKSPENCSLYTTVTNLLEFEGKYVIYAMDKTHAQSYQLWKAAGKPAFPDKRLRGQMRSVEEPIILQGPTNFSPRPLIFTLPSPFIVLIKICHKSTSSPGKVKNLNIFNITRNEILLTWKYSGPKCILDFEIFIERKGWNQFKRINKKKSFFNSFQYGESL